MGNLSGITDNGWDADAEAKKGSFDTLPPGDYVVLIASSEIKATKAGDGKYAKLEYQVVEGEYTGRKLWENLNLWNKNPTAVSFARGALALIQKACRLPKMGDTTEAHGIPFVIKVGVRRNKETGEDENQIKAYHPKGANMAPVAKPAGASSNPLK